MDSSAPMKAAHENAEFAIVVSKLAKRFKGSSGPVQALKQVDFVVPRSHVFCILGPNGAGKTTLLRILTTMMRPSAGTAFIEGFEIGRQNIDIRHLIGIVAQDNHFDRYLNTWQNLTLHAQMHGLEPAEYEPRLRALLERGNLWHRRFDSIDDFSGGMQRRVSLIRALLHQPRILFLDEPTTGLDPSARREIWETIESIKAQTTVILTTHYMEEADRLSDRIVMLNAGEIVMEGTPKELKSRISPPDTYELVLNGPEAAAYQARLANRVESPKLLDAHILQFRLSSPALLPDIVAAIEPGLLQSIGLAQADLEMVYLTAAGNVKAHGAAAGLDAILPSQATSPVASVPPSEKGAS